MRVSVVLCQLIPYFCNIKRTSYWQYLIQTQYEKIVNNSDFKGPPFGWSLLSIIGGLATAIALIAGLELSADSLRDRVYGPTNASSTSPSTVTKQP